MSKSSFQVKAKQDCKSYLQEVYTALFRKKTTAHEYSKLSKTLNLLDVTFLSIGTTLGVGPYIFIGEFAQKMGPAMILAYLMAAIVAFFSAACYAELASRAGGSGGAYSSAYIFIGELPAAIVGWHLSLQNIIGSALSVRGVGDLFDYMTNFTVSNYIKTNIIEFNTPLLGKYPDLPSFCIVFVVTTLVTFGLKEVSIMNGVLVAFNLTLILLIIIVTGSIGDWSNWKLPEKPGCGKGGFLPYGMMSLWKGSGLVLYAYLGFDAAIHAAAECYEPERVIPLALIVSNGMVFVLYLLQSFAYTLAWPYCDQVLEAPIESVFEESGVTIMSWITTIGIPVALMGSVLSSKFPLSRLLYAMAEDGLIYSYMGKLKLRTKVPVNALYTSGFLTGVCAALFDKKQLAELTCLATLLAYDIIAVMVIYLRYTDMRMEEPKIKNYCSKIFNFRPKALVPTKTTSRVVGVCCWIIILMSHPSLFLLRDESDYLTSNLKLVVAGIVGLFFLLMFIIISCQPKSEEYVSFKVKYVPLIPMLSVLFNAYLGITYHYYTWIRLTIFMGLGVFIYMSYGIWNSQLRKIGDRFY